jgi:hypothetical protein
VWVGGCTLTPIHYSYHSYHPYKVAVYALAEWADTLTLFHLYKVYVLFAFSAKVTYSGIPAVRVHVHLPQLF